MMSDRDHPLPVDLAARTKPPFDELAKAATACSISRALRTSIGLNSTLNDCITDWMTANWPVPAGDVGSLRTAARATPGATYLSSSDHFAAQTVFEQHKTRSVASRPRKIVDKAAAEWVDGRT